MFKHFLAEKRIRLQIFVYLLIVLFVDNFLLNHLDSPRVLLKWLEQLAQTPDTTLQFFSSTSQNIWSISLVVVTVFVLITLMLGLLKRRLFMLIPLYFYLIWVTLMLFVSVAILGINLWNPHSGAVTLLSDAVLVWLSIVLVFTAWYWVIDDLHHISFAKGEDARVNYLFPVQAENLPGWKTWKPNFLDYLFLSFNTTTAFGASDTIIISNKAKILVMIQGILSLMVFAVILGRAINIISP